MAKTILSHPAESRPAGSGGFHLSVIITLTLWFVLVLSLGAAGAFVGLPGNPPVAIAIGVGAPLLVFIASLRLSPSFRAFILSFDLRLITGIQAWRWAGLGFLFLYAYRVLPAVFAFPAGLGDMAIGITAPWVMLALVRQPGFASSAAFFRWNVLGILDLIVAVSVGGVSAMLSTSGQGAPSTFPMATLPLVLVPAFLVPCFLMLHAVALMQRREMIRSRLGQTL